VIPARHLPGRVVPALAPHDEHVGAAALLQRPDSEREQWLRERGMRVVVEVTDDGWIGERARLKYGMLAGDLAAGQLVEAEHRRALVRADAVVVPTGILARQLRPLNRNLFVVRNAVDPEDWPAPSRSRRDRPFRVGFAGSPSHLPDLHLIAPALEWAACQDGVEVSVIGLDPANDELVDEELPLSVLRGLTGVPSLFRSPRLAPLAAASALERRQRAWAFPYVHQPWTSRFTNYQAALAELDVAVAPIATESSARRSDSKLLEYAMAGVLPIVSDVATYDDWRGTAVRWAADAAGFEREVRWAVEHRDQVREQAKHVRRHVRARRTIEQEISRWREALLGA
jgi:glycosyltransferase involved in cell wall biosynthesis